MWPSGLLHQLYFWVLGIPDIIETLLGRKDTPFGGFSYRNFACRFTSCSVPEGGQKEQRSSGYARALFKTDGKTYPFEP